MFTSGTSSSQKVEKRWMKTLALDGPARQQPMKTLKQWRIGWLVPCNFFGYFGSEGMKLWKNNSWLLRHDNAPAHASLLVCNFLTKINTVIMPQPPYSPDLAPCDFFLFPRLKRPMIISSVFLLDNKQSISDYCASVIKLFETDILPFHFGLSTLNRNIERRSMGSPMVDSRWELAHGVRFPWLGAAQAGHVDTHRSHGDAASGTDQWVPPWPVFDMCEGSASI